MARGKALGGTRKLDAWPVIPDGYIEIVGKVVHLLKNTADPPHFPKAENILGLFRKRRYFERLVVFETYMLGLIITGC